MDANSLFDKYMSDVDITQADGTTEKAVEVGKDKVQSGADTFRWRYESGKKVKDYEKVCMRCINDIFTEAGIAMPLTNNVATFMDAVEGRPVELLSHIGEKRHYKPSKDWQAIDIASDLKAGDIMVVNNTEGGYHAVLIKNVTGTPDRNGLFRGYFNGVDVIHDRGAPLGNDPRSIQTNHYEWYELNEGQGGEQGPNRKFVRGYRFNPSTGDRNADS
mgnify:CR=1 FL=1